MKKYLKNLNEEQLKAVKHTEGPCLVLAGPGTGKTTVITSRICELIQSSTAMPENILVVTFSKSAAEEMKHRFRRLSEDCRMKNCEKVTFGTFHAVFFKLLVQYEGYKLENLIDEAERFSIIKMLIRKLELDYFEDEEQISDLINDIGYFMNTMSMIDKYSPSSCKKDVFSAILEAYIGYKNRYKKFDYDDMLVDCYFLLTNNKNALSETQNKFRYILIDEFQDINKVQYNTIELIAKAHDNIFVVGDDDQSIYGFRGADPAMLQAFENSFVGCKRILLINNYRSTEHILSRAQSVIANNGSRYSKDLKATAGSGDAPVVIQPEDFEAEAKAAAKLIRKKTSEEYKYSDIAVIYRTNIQARALIDALWDENIPFEALDGAASIYSHWVFKDIASYLRLALGVGSNNDIMRIINKPKRYISRAAVERASTCKGDLRNSLIVYGSLNPIQVRALDELRVSINRLKNMDTLKAVKYIRAVIGYDEYIYEYAGNKGINAAGLMEILDEAEGSSNNFLSIHLFLAHMEEMISKLNEKPKSVEKSDRIQLLTMHKSKGLEFPVVIICGAVDGLSPYLRDKENEALEEERRLFYVSMTRAKKELYIMCPKNRYKKKAEKSRFINEMYMNIASSVQNIKAGQKVYHKIFQDGIINKINIVNGSKRAAIDFGGVVKELDIITCIKNDIIRLIN
ncbi:MAG: ATP-dependent helicase [Bacillota bacterium]